LIFKMAALGERLIRLKNPIKNNNFFMGACYKFLCRKLSQKSVHRHCESVSPKQSIENQGSGLLRFARNDGTADF